MRHTQLSARRVRVAIIPVLLIAGLALAGCSAASTGSQAGGSGTSSSPSSGGVARDSVKESAAAPQTAERDQVVTGSVRMRVESAASAVQNAMAIVGRAGGRIDGRSETPRSGDAPASATLTLRIPASRVGAVLARLGRLGSHITVSTQAADVTATHRDTAARIASLQRSIAAFQGFLATAKTTTDLISLESAISDRQAELESLQAQQRGLDDQISLATIVLDVREAAPAVARAPGDFGSGLVTGWAAFVSFVTWMLVILGVMTPWIALAGLVLAVVFGLRWILRRRRPAGPAPTGPVPPASAA